MDKLGKNNVAKRGRRLSILLGEISGAREEIPISQNFGGQLKIYGDPWFPNWRNYVPQTNFHRNTNITYLINNETQQWDLQKLTTLYSEADINQISQIPFDPILNEEVQDRFIWRETRHGEFKVKDAYKVLFSKREQLDLGNSNGDRQIPMNAWKIIWQTKNIQPKLRFFIWKVCTEAIPTCVNLNKRFPDMDPKCQICGCELETTNHLLFNCPRAREIWYRSPVAIYMQGTEIDFTSIFRSIIPNMDMFLIQSLFAIMWEIWKSRYKWIFERRMTQIRVIRNLNPINVIPLDQITQKEIHCWVDFSLDNWGKSASACIIKDKRGCYLQVTMKSHNTILDTLQGGFDALTMAMGVISTKFPNKTCLFLTDNVEVARTAQECNSPNQVMPSSRLAIQRAMDCVLFKRRIKDPTIIYTPRERNVEVDAMANWARISGEDYSDSQTPRPRT
ncbi:hypothetical protein LUZ60_000232 [Juncus effusus]|nr:hypothetical protein LUZ60_000232 [Juncus effusus]